MQEQGIGNWSLMDCPRMRLVRECWCSNARNAHTPGCCHLRQAHSIVLLLQACLFENLLASNDLPSFWSWKASTRLSTNQKRVWNPFHFLARNQSECILWSPERLSESWRKHVDLAVFPTLGTFVFSKLEHQYTKCRRCAKRHIWLDPNRAESHKSPPNTGTSGPRWQAASMERPFVGGWDGLLYQLPKPRTDCDGDVQKELLKLKTELFSCKFQKLFIYMLHIMTLLYGLKIISCSFARRLVGKMIIHCWRMLIKIGASSIFFTLHHLFSPLPPEISKKDLGRFPHLQNHSPAAALDKCADRWEAYAPLGCEKTTTSRMGSQDLDLSVINNHGLVVSKSCKDRVVGPPSKWPVWYINRGDPNHLQVLGWSSKYQMDPEPIVIHGVLGPRKKKMAENKWL